MSEPRTQSEHDVMAAPHDAYAALLTQELRLPVAAILGLLQPLEEPIWRGDAAVLQQYVALLGARAQHVAKVADELTTFSALILGQPAADRHGAVVPLAALVRELAGERPVRVTIAPAADEPAVDTERLRLVLQVLLESAFTLNAPGTEVQVRAEVAGEPPRLVVRVASAGAIIPGDVRAALVRPLQQATSPGERRPSGLALALIVGRSAAAGAGGALLLERDRPATFRLELPIRDDPVARQARELRERVALADAQALRAIQDMRTVRDASIRERRLREAAQRRGARLQALHEAALALAAPAPTEPAALIRLLSGIVSGAVAAVGSSGGKLVLPHEPPWDALEPRSPQSPTGASVVALTRSGRLTAPAPREGRQGRPAGSAPWESIVVRHTGDLAREALRPEGDAAHAFQTGEAVFVADVTHPSPYGPFPAAVQRGVAAFAALPLRIGARTLGVLVMDFAVPGALTEEDREVLFLFASHAAAAVERVLLAYTERQLAGQTDQTAKREAEAAALRELDRLKSELLVMISHELRTPLTTVHGYAQLLAARATTADPAWVAQAATRMYARSEELRRLLEELTEFGQLERGEFDLHLSTFDLVPVLRDTVEDLRSQPGGERIKGRWPAHLAVYADPARVAQVVSKLLENALRYASQSPIVIRARRPGGRVSRRDPTGGGPGRMVRVEVEDRGPGIPPEEQQRIWEKLYRGPGVAGLNVARGSGIGLAVVKRLVEAQGGRVGLESRPGFGSCFWFELPAAGVSAITGEPDDSETREGAYPVTPANPITPATDGRDESNAIKALR